MASRLTQEHFGIERSFMVSWMTAKWPGSVAAKQAQIISPPPPLSCWFAVCMAKQPHFGLICPKGSWQHFFIMSPFVKALEPKEEYLFHINARPVRKTSFLLTVSNTIQIQTPWVRTVKDLDNLNWLKVVCYRFDQSTSQPRKQCSF